MCSSCCLNPLGSYQQLFVAFIVYTIVQLVVVYTSGRISQALQALANEEQYKINIGM